jgi:hypothetical protein
MAKRLDINQFIGKKFNDLTFLQEVEPHVTSGGNVHRSGLFLCSCGIEKKIQISNVLNSSVKSCGCHSKKMASKRITEKNMKHGLLNTSEYQSWVAMKKRCLNKNNHSYKNYGGRGIGISENWINSFEDFINDMGFKPDKNYSLERIDNSLGYSKENCKWATKKEQCRNVRSNVVIECNGQKKCLAEWAEIIGVSWQNLFYKLFKSKSFKLEELLIGKKI